MNRFMKTTLAMLVLGFFLLSVANTPTPVTAQQQVVWGDKMCENAVFTFEVTKFKTEKADTTASVALGGGPVTDEASVIDGDYYPVASVATPVWTDQSDFRNVITLGLGYEIEVTIDTRTTDYETENPGCAIVHTPAFYLPTNPHPSFKDVFVPTILKAKIKDTTGAYADAWLCPKFVEPMILPAKQLLETTQQTTFTELGAEPDNHWIEVATQLDGLGYWTLSYTSGLVPFPSPYDVGVMRTDTSTGITHSFEVLNMEMLAWMSGSTIGNNDNDLVEFEITWTDYDDSNCWKEEEPEETPTTDDGDSPGFELGVVLFSLASVAALVAYRKKK